MTAIKAHCRSGACYGRFCSHCHKRHLRKELPEDKWKGFGMILAKPCESVSHLFCIAERIAGNIFYLEEKCQNMQYGHIPQKGGVLFSRCKFKSLCNFLKLAVPGSQDNVNLLSVWSSMLSWKPFSGCMSFKVEGFSPELSISRHCRGVQLRLYVGVEGGVLCIKTTLSFWLIDHLIVGELGLVFSWRVGDIFFRCCPVSAKLGSFV